MNWDNPKRVARFPEVQSRLFPSVLHRWLKTDPCTYWSFNPSSAGKSLRTQILSLKEHRTMPACSMHQWHSRNPLLGLGTELREHFGMLSAGGLVWIWHSACWGRQLRAGCSRAAQACWRGRGTLRRGWVGPDASSLFRKEIIVCTGRAWHSQLSKQGNFMICWNILTCTFLTPTETALVSGTNIW